MLSAAGSRGGGPLAGGIDRNITTNVSRAFECHPGDFNNLIHIDEFEY